MKHLSLMIILWIAAPLPGHSGESFFSDAPDTYFASGKGISLAEAVDESIRNAGRQWLHAMFDNVDDVVLRENKMIAVLIDHKDDLVTGYQFIGEPRGAESYVTVDALIELDVETFEGYLEDEEEYAGHGYSQRNAFTELDRLALGFPQEYVSAALGEFTYDAAGNTFRVPVIFTLDVERTQDLTTELDRIFSEASQEPPVRIPFEELHEMQWYAAVGYNDAYNQVNDKAREYPMNVTMFTEADFDARTATQNHYFLDMEWRKFIRGRFGWRRHYLAQVNLVDAEGNPIWGYAEEIPMPGVTNAIYSFQISPWFITKVQKPRTTEHTVEFHFDLTPEESKRVAGVTLQAGFDDYNRR